MTPIHSSSINTTAQMPATAAALSAATNARCALLSWEEFVAIFRPVDRDGLPVEADDGIESVMLETFGEDLERALAENAARPGSVWTAVAVDYADEGGAPALAIMAGVHRVNREGMIITQVSASTPGIVVAPDMDQYLRLELADADGAVGAIRVNYHLGDDAKRAVIRVMAQATAAEPESGRSGRQRRP